MAGYIGSKASVISSGAERKKTFAITTSTTSLTGLAYTVNQVHVFHNGIRLVDGTDYTATDGTTITLTNAAANGDEVVVVSYAAFQTSDTYTKTEADNNFLTPTGDGSNLTGIAAFKPVAVTGTTPSLDVGSYNFFDQGTLTAATTVSFTNVPTNARWSYSCKTIADSGTWNVTAARYKTTFQVTVQEQVPESIFFKPDGTKFYLVGSSGDDVNEYDLSTAWDVSTASYLQNFSVSGQEANPTGVFFKPDGTKMYIIGQSGDDVNEYNLSTAWDISTASYLQNFSVASEEISPTDVFFKTDGTIMFVLGDSGNDIIAYDLSTAWDISTATYDPANAYSLAFYETVPLGFFFHPDGTKLFTVGSARDEVRQFELGSAIIPTFPAAVNQKPSSVDIGERVTYDFFTMDGGTTVKLIGEEVV